MGANTWDLNNTRGVDFLDQDFYNVKNSHQDLSVMRGQNSNVILRSLEVELLKQPFFDKLPEITDFGLLQQSQNRARF